MEQYTSHGKNSHSHNFFFRSLLLIKAERKAKRTNRSGEAGGGGREKRWEQEKYHRFSLPANEKKRMPLIPEFLSELDAVNCIYRVHREIWNIQVVYF